MNGICNGSEVDLDGSDARAARSPLAVPRRLTLLLALFLASCGGGAGGGGSSNAVVRPPSLSGTPEASEFFCTFQAAPAECNFQVQEKVQGRVSIVGFGRDGGTALRLHT